MGLFSGSKKTYVASSVYSLAGEAADRVNYTKSIVTAAVLTDYNNVAQQLMLGLTQGAAYNQYNFQKWSKNHLTSCIPTADLASSDVSYTDIQTIKPIIGEISGAELWITKAFIDTGDYDAWVEQWLWINKPYVLEDDIDYTADYNAATNKITITYTDETEDVFTPVNFDTSSKYLYVTYSYIYEGSSSDPTVVEQNKTVYLLSSVPLTGYTEDTTQYVPEDVVVSLNTDTTTKITYKDLTSPTETTNTSSSNELVTTYTKVYKKDVELGIKNNSNQITIRKYTLTLNKGYKVISKYDKTTTEDDNTITSVITKTDTIYDQYTYTISYTDVVSTSYSDPRIFIYKLGSGNASLDTLITEAPTDDDFFPVFPLRVNNKFVTDDDYLTTEEREDFVASLKKGYKKATNQKFSEIIDMLADNENLSDIDFAYLMYAVSVNEFDDSAKEYIYQFFKELQSRQSSSKAEYQGWYTQIKEQQTKETEYRNWATRMSEYYAKKDSEPEPNKPVYTEPKQSTFTYRCSNEALTDFRIVNKWSFIDETVWSGRGKANAKKGDIWFEQGEDQSSLINASADTNSNLRILKLLGSNEGIGTTVYMYKQTGDYTYKRLEIVGFVQKNYVYNNKATTEILRDAINESDLSGLVIPMIPKFMKKLTLKNQNQLATCNRILIINSYKIVKKKWYQSGFFSIFVAIAIAVVVTLVAGPAGAAATPGILGTNAAVGAALGFAAGTMAAVLAGAIANAVAAVLLAQMVSEASTAIFGEKWGAIIAAIVTFIIGYQIINDKSILSFRWSDLTNSNNLLEATKAIKTIGSGYVSGELQEMQTDFDRFMKNYDDKLDELTEATQELYKNGLAYLDVIGLMQSTNQEQGESSESFLNRTLLLGSDIVELSHGLIYNFTGITLKLE